LKGGLRLFVAMHMEKRLYADCFLPEDGLLTKFY